MDITMTIKYIDDKMNANESTCKKMANSLHTMNEYCDLYNFVQGYVLLTK